MSLATAGTGEAMAASGGLAYRRGLTYQNVLNGVFWLFIFTGSVVLIEPSPYDFLWMLAVALWALGGFKVHRGAILFVSLILAANLGGLVTVIPHLENAVSVTFVTQSVYLAIACIFFGLFFAENTLKRVQLCLSAFAASCIIAGILAVVGFLDIGGSAAIMAPEGRAMGGFKDPNVMGSYCILGLLYFAQRILTGATKHTFASMLVMMLVMIAIFLSFSRGSWGASVLGLAMVTGFTFLTTSDRLLRKRITRMFLALAVVVTLAFVILLSIESIGEFFLQRFSLTQSYDEGITGRFGNQLRSIPMMFDRPLGFGPLKYRDIFQLDPHSSYIGAFANYGWFGGFAWIALVCVTTFVGFRLCLTSSPYMRQAQVVWPALFGFFLQAFQIDIDHWRFVFLEIGLIWGLEIARQKWAEKQTA